MAQTRRSSRKRKTVSEATENTARNVKRKARPEPRKSTPVIDKETPVDSQVVSDVSRDVPPEEGYRPVGFKREHFRVWDLYCDEKFQNLTDAHEMIEALKEHVIAFKRDMMHEGKDIECECLDFLPLRQSEAVKGGVEVLRSMSLELLKPLADAHTGHLQLKVVPHQASAVGKSEQK